MSTVNEGVIDLKGFGIKTSQIIFFSPFYVYWTIYEIIECREDKSSSVWCQSWGRAVMFDSQPW